jgi:hypothetical protein
MRKTSTLTITDKGRDEGKVFVLQEMSADQAERWAIRALLALTKAGVDLPAGAAEAGMAGIAASGLQALGQLDFATIEPLLTEMWECVRYRHKEKGPLQSIVEGENSQIEEVATRIQLRMAVFRLHTDFFSSEAAPPTGLKSKAAPAA